MGFDDKKKYPVLSDFLFLTNIENTQWRTMDNTHTQSDVSSDDGVFALRITDYYDNCLKWTCTIYF